MYHTTNDTTTVIGCATATVIADTMAERTPLLLGAGLNGKA